KLGTYARFATGHRASFYFAAVGRTCPTFALSVTSALPKLFINTFAVSASGVSALRAMPTKRNAAVPTHKIIPSSGSVIEASWFRQHVPPPAKKASAATQNRDPPYRHDEQIRPMAREVPER